jgi:hypothetical protein
LTYRYRVRIAAQTGVLGVNAGWACTSAGSKEFDVRRGTAAVISTKLQTAKRRVKERRQAVRQVQQLAGADPDGWN